ncbi:MAG: hypothetical protein U9O41_01905 [Candidatus Aerophobetes bacterium]|nr:hypothetical protein [Candidatus Aerophobetes bacterium]
MKNINSKIPPYIARCLWSFDLNNFDLEKHKELIITQVLNYGDWQGVKWLYKTYSEEEVKEVVKHPRRGLWFKKVLNFWQIMLKIKIPQEEFQKAIIRLGERELK